MTAADDQLPEKDQSMDDILASIRRIMLDEQARLQDGPGALAYSATRSPSAHADPVVILDSSMVVEEMPPQRHAPFFSEDTEADVVAEPPELAAETSVDLVALDMTGEEPVPPRCRDGRGGCSGGAGARPAGGHDRRRRQ